MFTLMAFCMLIVIGISADRMQRGDADNIDQNMKHSRQDLRLVVYLLGAVLFMLGIIADRLH